MALTAEQIKEMDGMYAEEQASKNTPKALPSLTKEQIAQMEMEIQEEGLGVGYGEDIMGGALFGAAANIVGKPLLKAASHIPGAGRVSKWVDDGAEKVVEYADKVLPNWMTGFEKRLKPQYENKASYTEGLASRAHSEARSFDRVIERRNKVLNKSDEVDQSVQHIDPRWYDPRQDIKKVRMGGTNESNTFGLPMILRSIPLAETKGDLLTRMAKIKAAKKE